MNSIIRMYSNRHVAMQGKSFEVRQMSKLIDKWGGVYKTVEDLMDDGLTFNSHCVSLYIQHDRRAWSDMEDLFTRTKAKGKTVKTVWKKVDYFRKGFNKVVNTHWNRLCEVELRENQNKSWDERFHVDSGLENWWLNYYFAEHDAEMGFKPVELYPIDEDYAHIISNAQALERNCRGNTKPPKLKLFGVSEKKLEVSPARKCMLKFEWADTDDAFKLMGLFGHQYKWETTPNLAAKFRTMFPKVSFTFMDTPESLYGDRNNWFYIIAEWKPENFTWGEVQKIEKAVKKWVMPHMKTFRPENVPAKYSVVTLGFK